MNELQEANPETGGLPPSGTPEGWNHLLQWLLCAWPPTPHHSLLYTSPLGPSVHLYPATGLGKLRWRTMWQFIGEVMVAPAS